MDKQTLKKVNHFIYRINETTNPKTQWVTDILIKDTNYEILLGRLYIENIRLEDDDTLVIMYYNRMFRLKINENTQLEIIKQGI